MSERNSRKRDIHQYRVWRNNLVPLPDGTILKWTIKRSGLVSSDDIKAGTFMKIIKLSEPLTSNVKCVGDLIYCIVVCSKTGKEFKRQHRFTVEGIAQYLEEGAIQIVKD